MADRYPNRPQMADDSRDRAAHRQPDTGEGDPLAELARLIGQTDPQSNFARGRPGGAPQAARSLATDFAAGAPSWLQTAQANLQPTVIGDRQQEAREAPVVCPIPSILTG